MAKYIAVEANDVDTLVVNVAAALAANDGYSKLENPHYDANRKVWTQTIGDGTKPEGAPAAATNNG